MKILPLNEDFKPTYLESVEDHGRFFLVRLQGELNMHALEHNREKMTKVLETYGIYDKANLCDFGKVTDCDTATVAALITRLSEFRKHGTANQLIFFNINGQLCALFQITHLAELFRVCKSQEEAEAALEGFQKTVR